MIDILVVVRVALLFIFYHVFFIDSYSLFTKLSPQGDISDMDDTFTKNYIIFNLDDWERKSIVATF